jgi:oxygen-dependent protoporphyrinogen oxidase
MPGPGGGLIENFMTLIREPCLRWAPLASIREYRNPPRLPSVKDETVYEFITRRFGTKDAADMTLSAVLHGIYAGDITQLSAKSLFPQFWYLEEKYGSIIKGLYAAGTGRFWMHEDDVKMVKELKPKIEASLYNSLALGASVFSFKKGIGAIAVGLENSLLANPKVTFRKGFYVQSMSYKGESDKIEVIILALVLMFC